MTYGLAILGALSLTALGAGCDSGSGNGTPVVVSDAGATDTTATTDSGGTADTTATQDTGTTTDTGTTDTGTTDAGTTDTGTTDTGTTDTGTTVERLCTDAELGAFNSCAQACNGDTACQQGCLTSELSAACQGAYGALAQCVQAAGCGASDVACAQSKCPDKFAAVFGTGPEPTSCNPVTDDGCDAGQNCTIINQQNELGCVTPGTAGIDEDCSQTGCADGACLSSDGVNSACSIFCDPNNNTCPDGRPCNMMLQGTNLTVCGGIPTACNLFAQDCPAPKGCYIIDQAGNTDCVPSAGKTEGTACQYVNDCAPGLMCAGAQGQGTCLPFCNPDGSTPCATGNCQQVMEGVGVCVTQ